MGNFFLLFKQSLSNTQKLHSYSYILLNIPSSKKGCKIHHKLFKFKDIDCNLGKKITFIVSFPM